MYILTSLLHTLLHAILVKHEYSDCPAAVILFIWNPPYLLFNVIHRELQQETKSLYTWDSAKWDSDCEYLYYHVLTSFVFQWRTCSGRLHNEAVLYQEDGFLHDSIPDKVKRFSNINRSHRFCYIFILRSLKTL